MRIAILDLEASSLDRGSYPVEVGIAVIQGASHPIRTWSSLIRPTDDWIRNGIWSPASEQIHEILLDALRLELAGPLEVASMLNAALRGKVVVLTDAPQFDQIWLARLYEAAGLEQGFVIYDIERIAGYLNPDEYRQFVHLLSRSRIPHRAGPDAVRLASAMLEARLGYRPQVEPLLVTE